MKPMEDYRDGETDMQGRLLALEQKFKGLNARLCAIEMSISRNGVPDAIVRKNPNVKDYAGETENCVSEDFVPASACLNQSGEKYDDFQKRLETLERLAGKPVISNSRLSNMPLFDITGLIAGSILIAVSLLLYTQNFEMLKNPVLPLASGAILMACVALKLYKK